MAVVPTCVAKKSNYTNVTGASPTATMVFTEELIDTAGNGWSGGDAEKVYARSAGIYLIYASTTWQTATGSGLQVQRKISSIRINNTSNNILLLDDNSDMNSVKVNHCGLWKFNANDYLWQYTITLMGTSIQSCDVGNADIGISKINSEIGARVTSPNSGPSDGSALQFSSETFDDGNLFSSGANTRLTAPESGLYFISGYVMWDTDDEGYPTTPDTIYTLDDDYRKASIRYNGTDIIARASRHAGTHRTNESFQTRIDHNPSCIYLMNAGDYVELVVNFTGDGNVNTVNSFTHFSMAKLL